jgi:hypothetical protein
MRVPLFLDYLLQQLADLQDYQDNEVFSHTTSQQMSQFHLHSVKHSKNIKFSVTLRSKWTNDVLHYKITTSKRFDDGPAVETVNSKLTQKLQRQSGLITVFNYMPNAKVFFKSVVVLNIS